MVDCSILLGLLDIFIVRFRFNLEIYLSLQIFFSICAHTCACVCLFANRFIFIENDCWLLHDCIICVLFLFNAHCSFEWYWIQWNMCSCAAVAMVFIFSFLSLFSFYLCTKRRKKMNSTKNTLPRTKAWKKEKLRNAILFMSKFDQFFSVGYIIVVDVDSNFSLHHHRSIERRSSIHSFNNAVLVHSTHAVESVSTNCISI